MGRFMSPRGTQGGLGGFETAGTAISSGMAASRPMKNEGLARRSLLRVDVEQGVLHGFRLPHPEIAR